MATTSIWSIKNNLKQSINYIINPEKTINKDYSKELYNYLEINITEYNFKNEKVCYVSSLNCSEDNPYEDMKFTKERFRKTDGILAFHGYQSFKENEVTPDIAHEIGVKFAEEMFKDYEVIVSTHQNTNHIHNHFILNSVSFKTGKKYNNNRTNLAKLRHISDSLCAEYGLSVLDEDLGYKYIIIDEFQDTSLIRFNLIKKIKDLSNAILFCVGDDYQSIYHFSGCDINIFLNFTKYVPNSQIKKLKYTYRNSQELIDISSKFVMKNKSQIKKKLLSHKHLDKPIEFIYYINPYKCFKELYNKLKKENNDLLILGRNNFDINKFNKEKIKEFMSVHSSKGLEAENVILINLTDGLYGFPNKIINSKLIEELHPSDKTFLYAEERRLFYVALTRTKNKVYILVPFFNKSIFIKELKKIMRFK